MSYFSFVHALAALSLFISGGAAVPTIGHSSLTEFGASAIGAPVAAGLAPMEDAADAIDYIEHGALHVRLAFTAGIVLTFAVAVYMFTAGIGVGTAAPLPIDKKHAEVAEGAGKVQELERQRLELAAEVAELSEKIEVARRPPMTDEELREKAYTAGVRAEEALRRRVETFISTVAPVAVRARRVQDVLRDTVEATRTKAVTLATDKGTAMFDMVLRSLEVDMSTVEALQYLKGMGSELGPDGEELSSDALPLSLLLAGLIAPMQLQFIVWWNRFLLWLMVPLLLLCIGVMSFDIGRPCGTGTIWIWTIGLVMILGVGVCARLVLLSRGVALMKETRHDIIVTRADSGEDWILQMRQRLVESSEDFFHALVGYDKLAGSWPSSVLNVVNAVQILWGGLGVFWTLSNLILDDTNCQADALRFFAHGYALVYVMLLTWTVPMFLLWIATNILSTKSMSLELLRRAKQFDNDYSVGVPVLTLLCRIFLLQSVADIRGAEVSGLQGEMLVLAQEKEQIRSKAEALEAEIEEKEQRYQEMMAAQRADLEGPADGAGAAGMSDEDHAAAARALAMAALARAREAGLDVEALVQRAQEAAAKVSEAAVSPRGTRTPRGTPASSR